MAVYAHAGKGIFLFPKIPYTSRDRMPLGSVLHKDDRTRLHCTPLIGLCPKSGRQEPVVFDEFFKTMRLLC